MVIILHKINPAVNCRRFYRVAVVTSLFDEVMLIRAWGRIGGKVRQAAPLPFADSQQAENAASKIINEKLRSGYQVKEPAQ